MSAYKKKVKRVLRKEKKKNVKNKIKLELPPDNKRGFVLEDYVKGKRRTLGRKKLGFGI